MELAPNAVVLVADGRKLVFLRNGGDPAHPNLTVEMAEEHPNPANRDQATDAAGRAASTTGSSVEPTDFHQLEEDRFAAEAAAMLKARALADNFEQLIIIAPPRTLGELRKHYHQAVVGRLVSELAKDLTGHSVADIEAAIRAA